MYNIAINRNMEQGLLIVIDGPSASGKESIIKRVLKDLDKLNIRAISIEETKEKNYDRKKILDAKQYGDQEIAKVIINERKKIYQAKVIPQLSSGIVVIANRGEPTTLGYQTVKNEITMEDVWNMHRIQNIPLPDLIVIANCSVEEAVRRESLRKLAKEEKDKNFMSGKFTQANFEKRKQIHSNYEKVKKFLERKGLSVIYLNTDAMKIPEESRIIVSFIEKRKQFA